MKFIKTKNQYKASNVILDLNSNEAISYNWWVFFKKINGKNVFNDCKYSSSTIRHQYKVKKLLNDLNIKIDLFIDSRLSLKNELCLNDAVLRLEIKNKNLLELINKKGTKKDKNKDRKKEIKENNKQIKKIKKLIGA